MNTLRIWTFILLLGLGLAGPAPARAALDVGEPAPDFTVQAALAGKSYSFALREALAKGPVVLYFFPAAFSVGCSIEAKEFADAIAKFDALGATVIGVSSDDIDTLGKFSVQACAGRFPVASDPTQKVMKSYDAVLALKPDYANRVTYLISPQGRILFQYQSLNPSRHVEKTLAALKDWSQTRKP